MGTDISVTLNGNKVGSNHPPFIVAEISANHKQSLDAALQLVEAAKEAGVDAVKFQTFTPNSMTLDVDRPEFRINDHNSLWNGKTLYELYKEAALPYEWHAPLFERCRELNLIPFSTPFDKEAVALLESLKAPFYKVASLEIVDLPLIRTIAQTKKPIIFSTGASTLEEIEEAVDAACENGCNDIILLKCTSAYPADAKDANIRTIVDLKEHFGCPVGISDHILNSGAAIAAVALGGCLIEKHLTLSRSEGGLDAAFSLEPKEMKVLVEEAHTAWKALGDISYGSRDSEKLAHSLRRSLRFANDLLAGHSLTEEDIAIVRPGGGLSPKFYEELIGVKLNQNVAKGEAISRHLLSSASEDEDF